MAGPYTYTSTGTGNWSTVARWTGGQGSDYPGQIHTISGAADNGSGLIRLTIASTATFVTGDTVHVSGVLGTTEAVGMWVVTVVDGTHLDLQSSTFTNAYTSGGRLARNDKVVVNSTITADVDADIGTSPTDGTPANNYILTINTGAGRQLTLAPGVEITTRGGLIDAQSAAYGIVWGAGSKITFDATLASSAMKYPYRIASTYNSGTTTRGWDVNGTSGAHCVLQSAGDGTRNAYYLHGGNGGEGTIDAEYLDFINMGDATNPAWRPTDSQRAQVLRLANCTFDQCGEVLISIASTQPATCGFTDVVWTNGRVDESSTYTLNFANASSNQVVLTRCVLDKKFFSTSPAGLKFANSYIHKVWSVGGNTLWAGIEDSFVRAPGDFPVTNGSVKRCFLYQDAPASGNPHGPFPPTGPTAGSNIEWTDNVYYFNGAAAAGEAFFTSTASTAHTLTVVRNLILPNSAGLCSGSLMTSGGAIHAGFRVVVEHNTAWIAGHSGLQIGHLYTTADSRYQSTKSNLFIGDGDELMVLNVDASTTEDLIDPTAADYNSGYRCAATFPGGVGVFTNQGRSYASKWSITPGANDVPSVDPAFVDSARSLATWAVTRGSVSATLADKEADACAYLAADPTLTASSLLPYLTAGWQPTAAALRGAAHDGGDIGAFSYQASGTASDRVVFGRRPGFGVGDGQFINIG